MPSTTAPARPRAHTENNLTIFTNGHHKPGQKHNTMAHKCGLPYVVPRAHSIHGASPSGLAHRSVDNLPHTSTIDALHSDSLIKDSIVSAQQEHRMVKSEHGSPHMGPVSNLDQLNGALPPLDISSFPSEYNFLQNLEGFTSIPDHDQPLFSAGLSSASIDWSHYDGLDFNSDEFGASSYSQAASFNGFDFSSVEQPALTTTSTSGEVSEIEDFPNLETATRPSILNHQYGSDFDTSDFGGDIDGYRLSNTSSYIGHPQGHTPANGVDAVDMDSFLKGVNSANGFTPSTHSLPATVYDNTKNEQAPSDLNNATAFLPLSSEEESDIFWMNDFAANNVGNTSLCEPYGETEWIQ